MAQPRTARFGLVFIWGIAAFCLIGAAAFYFRGAPEGDAYEEQRAVDRTKRLAEVREAEEAKLSKYEWIDKEKGSVRIPIKRAMEITLEELSRKGPAPSAEKAEAAPSLVVPPYLKTAAPETSEAPASEAAPADSGAPAPAATPAPAPEATPATPAASPAPAAATPAAAPGGQ